MFRNYSKDRLIVLVKSLLGTIKFLTDNQLRHESDFDPPFVETVPEIDIFPSFSFESLLELNRLCGEWKFDDYEILVYQELENYKLKFIDLQGVIRKEETYIILQDGHSFSFKRHGVIFDLYMGEVSGKLFISPNIGFDRNTSTHVNH